MTFDFGGWLGGNGSIVQAQYPLRAQLAYRRITDKPFDIILRRGSTRLDPQEVRIEFEQAMLNVDSELGKSALRRGTILGVRGHPEIDDLDIHEWDTFSMDDMEFTVTFVNRTLIGEIQADFEAV